MNQIRNKQVFNVLLSEDEFSTLLSEAILILKSNILLKIGLTQDYSPYFQSIMIDFKSLFVCFFTYWILQNLMQHVALDKWDSWLFDPSFQTAAIDFKELCVLLL